MLYEHYIRLKILFLKQYSTLHGTVPFDQIKTGDYVPAIREGIRRQNAEIDAIINNPASPDICKHNSGLTKSPVRLLQRVNTVFGNLLSAETRR